MATSRPFSPPAVGASRASEPRLAAREAALVAGLLLLALAVRSLAWRQTAVLFNDGPLYLGLARLFAAGEHAAALSHDYHPLYPALVAGVHALGALASAAPSWESAAVGVSVAGGVLAVLACYALVRATFGPPEAALVGLLLAVHPRLVEFTSDVQSEGVYLAAFASALWLGWRALDAGRPRDAFAVGVASGLAYLARPEGLGVALVVGGIGGLRALRGRRPPGPSLRWGAGLLLGLALVALPYATLLRVERGSWTLTQKKSIGEMVRLSDAVDATAADPTAALPGWPDPEARAHRPRAPRADPARGSPGAAASELLGTAVSAAGFELLCPLLLGLWVARGRPGPRARYFLALVGLYTAVLLVLTLSAGYVSRRHALPVLLVASGYIGVGLRWMLDRAREPGVWRPRPDALRARLGWLLVVAALAVGLVVRPVRELREQRADQLATRRAAEWLREARSEPGPVAARRRRDAYYAGAPHAPVADLAPASLVAALRAMGAPYLVVDRAELPPGGVEALTATPGVRLLHRASARGREGLVFAVAASGGDP